ncbi:glycine dehydrogenase [decarboxylating], mitochondrial [Sphaeroforma arctica JP610]|uniref:Glycine cleavage system P protein n=1 Tax=Sphaeroforma arctica JP610 TaxID=667725 RepID=A0A0L0G943_9EUKA|nr:glycine dehydrogenase [decarboxylating], mitochondrial [Sphaeroforma arctica JP610]KNC85547.1 glycine dehydrogenase [decarboxylating], mitochondrial [Sphaeroforma arctica JP610]|eukprot:XP_014159449.1 glycine dehydrogenase [decarboxylating], mitochondrial [Sphaeroforma arctica JP610]
MLAAMQKANRVLTVSGRNLLKSQFRLRSALTEESANVTNQETLSKATLMNFEKFSGRHVGPRETDVEAMLRVTGLSSINELVQKTIPNEILFNKPLNMKEGFTETECLERLAELGKKNKVQRSYIGTGYYNTIVPPVIQRVILENPGWYTQYTPYQPEIAQGRLESLMNYQTMVTDMTGMAVSNASLLDEATACAEAMAMCFATRKSKRKHVFLVDDKAHPQNIELMRTRAGGMGITVRVADFRKPQEMDEDVCGVLIQYPNTVGAVADPSQIAENAHAAGAQVVMATDLLALTQLKPPGELGADIVVGNTQRFGVPLGYGGPHAAFMATTDKLVRKMPGRIVGMSKDRHGNPAYRLALQVREQHIRREKATSNICTAQALLANMSAFYALYHGPTGLNRIATRVHTLASVFASGVESQGHKVKYDQFFDTVCVELSSNLSTSELENRAGAKEINLRVLTAAESTTAAVCVSIDETTTEKDLNDLLWVFSNGGADSRVVTLSDYTDNSHPVGELVGYAYPHELVRTSEYLTHPVFNTHHSEAALTRYAKTLENKDLSLCHSMIALGSCTMKLNGVTTLKALSNPDYTNIHPFAPLDQAKGYYEMFEELCADLCEISGYDSVSLQPNSGAQGEYAGLMAIRAYLDSKGQQERNICLIPSSAHGTNPASAQMCGMKVVAVRNDAKGNIDMADLHTKVNKHSDNLAAIMITYPSTYGVFEEGIRDMCDLVHQHGGQVYLDGANMNAQVGLCRPGDYGSDVSHFNLHKTFCIPHGGGGPGMGPIGVKSHLAPFLPTHNVVKIPGGGIGPAENDGNSDQAFGMISGAPFGSAAILPISWAYIRMMGPEIVKSTHLAILSANYLASRLRGHYEILYTGTNGTCAHEFILDVRKFQQSAGIESIDIAKRLIDYGFHSPTMSWPVNNTLMIEPTESESKEELDRFADALISIRAEIKEIEEGAADHTDNVLKNAPHTAEEVSSDKWEHNYTRSKAAWPVTDSSTSKFWPTVGRVDDVFGDRNLRCTL